MNKLATTYLGLQLKSPVIAGSSGLTASLSKIEKMIEAGAGAIVLKSLFEEQINNTNQQIESHGVDYPEAMDYIRAYNKSNSVERYLELIAEARKAALNAHVPIIASVSCLTAKDWIEFSKQIEQAGADALELNLFVLPVDKQRKGAFYEQTYFDLLDKIKQLVKIPVAVKLGGHFTNLLNVIQELYFRKVNGIVLFNKFYEPDIDIDKLEIVSGSVFSHPFDLRLVLRWIALVSAEIPQVNLSASTGIHDGRAAVKQLLAGATTVQMCSSLYQNGVGSISMTNEFILNWMQDHQYNSISEFRGALNYSNIPNPAMYERSQFMKYYSSKTDGI